MIGVFREPWLRWLQVRRERSAPYTTREDRGVKYVSWRPMLMADWDVPDPVHPAASCTVASREEAYRILEQRCRDRPDERWAVYETPGGVRAFLVSREMRVGEEAERLMTEVRCDPLYVKLSRRGPGFWCRVSPKPGRAGDYVARKVGEVGTGEALPSLASLVEEHDRLVRSNLKGVGS